MQTIVRVLFLFQPSEALLTHLTEGIAAYQQQIEFILPTAFTEADLLPLVEGVHIMIGWRPTTALLEAAKDLRLLINPGAGVKHQIPLFRAINQQRKVTLVNGHGNAFFTAQHTVSLLLSLTNKIVPHHNWLSEGKWRLGDKEGASIPLREKTLGLLGYGAVNQKVHQLLSGFPLNFAALKTSWDSDNEIFPTPLQTFVPSELEAFLRLVDILVIVLPHTEETEGMIGQEELTYLGKQSLLVNTGRGAIIQEKALYDALLNHQIQGAAIDVWYNYRPEADEQGRKYPYQYPFHELDNVVLSPHRGASPMSDLRRWNEVIENLIRFTEDRELINVVDLEREY